MKILKKILLIIVILIAIPLITALFISREYSVEREVIINKPKHEVFNYIKYLKNQQNYNIWIKMDPGIEMQYNGTDGTKGFVYSWTSKEVGQGEQTIRDIKEGELMDLEIHFIKPFEGFANTPIRTEAISENQTKVRWQMSGKSSWPMNFMNLFMDNTIGKDIQGSLNNLKSILEN